MPHQAAQNVVNYAKAISAHRKLNAPDATIAGQTEVEFDVEVASGEAAVDAVQQKEIEIANLRSARDVSIDALLTLCDRYVDRLKSDHERDSEQVRTLPHRPVLNRATAAPRAAPVAPALPTQAAPAFPRRRCRPGGGGDGVSRSVTHHVRPGAGLLDGRNDGWSSTHAAPRRGEQAVPQLTDRLHGQILAYSGTSRVTGRPNGIVRSEGSSQMLAAVFPEPHQLTVSEIPDPTPGPGEVLVAVKAAGVCGTDVHIYEGDFIGAYPVIPGHEFSGDVVALGEGVATAAVGDRVAVQPCLFCETCDYCAAGEGNFCRDLKAYGVHVNGGFADYCVVRAANLVRLGDLSYLAGALLEPLACCIHGIKQLGVVPGDNVVVFGSGPIGLMLAQLARNGGAAMVTVVDPVLDKLAVAAALSMDHALTPTEFQAQRERLAPGGFHLAIDATGVAAVAESLFGVVRDRGRVLFFGVCPQQARISVSPYDVYKRELKVSGTFSLFGEMDAAVRLARSGRVELEKLVSERLPLLAFQTALTRKSRGGAELKIVLEPGT